MNSQLYIQILLAVTIKTENSKILPSARMPASILRTNDSETLLSFLTILEIMICRKSYNN